MAALWVDNAQRLSATSARMVRPVLNLDTQRWAEALKASDGPLESWQVHPIDELDTTLGHWQRSQLSSGPHGPHAVALAVHLLPRPSLQTELVLASHEEGGFELEELFTPMGDRLRITMHRPPPGVDPCGGLCLVVGDELQLASAARGLRVQPTASSPQGRGQRAPIFELDPGALPTGGELAVRLLASHGAEGEALHPLVWFRGLRPLALAPVVAA
jgi:hypothetical protein